LRVAAVLVLASGVALLAGALALFTAGTHPARAQRAPEGFVQGEVLVKFEPGASGQEIAEAHRQNGGQVEEVIPGIEVRVVDVPVGRERSIAAAYERNPDVRFAEVNKIIRVADHGVPNDPQVGEQWQYNNTAQNGGTDDADIDAFEAWHVTRGNNTVATAILDTGIDQSHEDLQAKIEKYRNFTTKKSVNDINGHGTRVAGSVAAVTSNGVGVAGTCPDCSLYNVKVLGNNGIGKLSWLVRGITWAADNDADVINMSLGGSSGSRTLRKAVNYAWRKGVVLVAAAGNHGRNDPFYPAYYPKVIAVASTDHNDAKAGSSNYGKKWVDIGAPGVNILSTLPGNRYGRASGTSLAAPHVAGVAGLVWSTGLCDDGDPATNDNVCVRNRIETGADTIPGLAEYWPDGRRLNAATAVAPPSGP
jgi:thermitase